MTADTPESLPDRIKRSRQALTAWTHEAALPWADKPMTLAIAETEIGLLRELCEEAPAEEFDQVATLLRGWEELRDALLS